MSLKVLIVDDDDITLFIHELMIKESGLSKDSFIFKNGRVALDFLDDCSKEEEQFLIFLDVNMPVMDGWNLLDAIQESSCQKQVNVVMVTSSLDQSDRKKARKYPQVIDYVEKPLNMEACLRIKQLPQINRLR